MPEPSRDKLSRIIAKWSIGTLNDSFSRWELGLPKDCIADLLDWADGEETWCSHISGVGEVKLHWYITYPDLVRVEVDDTWDICPVKDCHKPRPE